jgi:hypothetical protein
MKGVKGTKIDGWRDLEPFGFIGLTGEACGLGLRYLVDLTPEGVETMESFLSTTIQRGNNWNSREGQVASLLLPWGMWRDVAIYVLAKRHSAIVSIDIHEESWSASYVEGMSIEEYGSVKEWLHNGIYKGRYHVYFPSGTAPGGMRNQHVFSGRTE